MALNETKLSNLVGARELRPATEEEIREAGAEPGYASPINLKRKRASKIKAVIIVDDAIPTSPNLVAGANENGYHLRNVNYGSDFTADIVADIAAAEETSLCPECGVPMQTSRGVEVGNIFKLGTHYSESMNCMFLDREGQRKPVVMGSYGIGTSRLLACVAEENQDEHGLCWPITVAPYQVYLVLLRGKGEKRSATIAERLYQDLGSNGIEVLFDDRDESPGVKFNDADLIGCPIRITASERGLSQDCVEIKLRSAQHKDVVPLSEVINHTQTTIQSLQLIISTSATKMIYQE